MASQECVHIVMVIDLGKFDARKFSLVLEMFERLNALRL